MQTDWIDILRVNEAKTLKIGTQHTMQFPIEIAIEIEGFPVKETTSICQL